MNGQQLVANIDMDGVVYDFVDAMREAFDYRYGQAMLGRGEATPTSWPDPTRWSVWNEWPITRDDFYEVLYAEVLDGHLFRRGNAIDGAIDGIGALKELGYHVRIVTSKTFHDRRVTEKARIGTLRWLYDHDVPYDTITFTDVTAGKAGIRADVVVDDKPKVEGWLQPQAANVLFDQPWNRTIPEFTEIDVIQGSFTRARGWDDVVAAADLASRQGVLL